MDRRPRSPKPETRQGICATIAAAAAALLVQPLPILLPVAVDLWLWRGPRLSPEAITAPLAAVVAAQSEADARLAETLLRWGREGDLGAVLGWFLPSLLGAVDPVAVSAVAARPVLAPGLGIALLLLLALLLLAALGLMALKTPLARMAGGLPPFGRGLGRDVLRNAARYLAFLGLVAAVAIAAAGVVGVGLAATTLVGVDLFPLAGLVASLAVVVGAVLLAFVAEAIAVARVGPVAAARLSVRVVAAQPWTVLGLLLVLWLAIFTLPQVLTPLLTSGVGTGVAIACYAAVATALALARVIFFAERLPDGVVSRAS